MKYDLEHMKQYTSARIGIGNSGPRLKTKALLEFRADHAAAVDSVWLDHTDAIIQKLDLFTVQTLCQDKNMYLTRPDLGRRFDEANLQIIRNTCIKAPDVQIYAADGLSSKAIEANLDKILPMTMNTLIKKGYSVGTPFFVKFGRVASMDHVSEAVGSKVTCVLIGERPGLGSAESMSAYVAYHAYVGMPEAKRTVISNIHSNGLPAVEAGACLVDLIETMLNKQASGVELAKLINS